MRRVGTRVYVDGSGKRFTIRELDSEFWGVPVKYHAIFSHRLEDPPDKWELVNSAKFLRRADAESYLVWYADSLDLKLLKSKGGKRERR